jgi:serine/threonine-protein kinase
MPTASRADRNLLFGILALQLDFISRDNLIQAMHAWALEKSKLLGHILMDQGIMSSDEHALLESLVQKHLERHSNDPERSLAALSSTGMVRQDLEEIADVQLQSSLAQLADASVNEREGSGNLETTAGLPTSPEKRFAVLRPYARGGLGEVSVARDQELHRDVALKEIQTKHADHPESRTRFLREAEITGQLEHPGIVPVYGLGQYSDGRPYYAMRFIKGESLKAAIDRFHKQDYSAGGPSARSTESVLRSRDLLTRFVSVCNTAAYAHSRGVLHRDLKPSNIILGEFGETLVVDWGLAKTINAIPRAGDDAGSKTLHEFPFRLAISDADTDLTQMGRVLGTPPFMSPEQATGRLDLMGPASDVYSLGATLYYVLTGKTPFSDLDTREILDHVQRGDFIRPRQLDPHLAPDLEAICLKAMAVKPENRYSSALALAEDLERWLAEEPVTAYSEPITVRVARWARRHERARGVALSLGFIMFTIFLSILHRSLDLGKFMKVPYALLQDFWLPILFLFWFVSWQFWKLSSKLLPGSFRRVAQHWAVTAVIAFLISCLPFAFVLWVGR